MVYVLTWSGGTNKRAVLELPGAQGIPHHHCGCGPHVIHGVKVTAPQCRPPTTFFLVRSLQTWPIFGPYSRKPHGQLIVVDWWHCVVWTSGGSECANSGSSADVLVHWVASVVPWRGELLRSTRIQLLHADEDRDSGVESRGCNVHWVGHRNARHAVKSVSRLSVTLTTPISVHAERRFIEEVENLGLNF